MARLATRRAKPGGSYHLVPTEIPEFLAPLDIADLHGFGWSSKQKTKEKLGVTTLGELAKKSKGILISTLGKSTGETLYNAVRGIDDKKLESDKPRKSVSCEINVGMFLFAVDLFIEDSCLSSTGYVSRIMNKPKLLFVRWPAKLKTDSI